MEKKVELESKVVVEERKIRQADSAWSCLVCFSATLSYLVVLGSQFSFGVIFDALIEEYGESRSKTGEILKMLFNIINQAAGYGFSLTSA